MANSATSVFESACSPHHQTAILVDETCKQMCAKRRRKSFPRIFRAFALVQFVEVCHSYITNREFQRASMPKVAGRQAHHGGRITPVRPVSSLPELARGPLRCQHKEGAEPEAAHDPFSLFPLDLLAFKGFRLRRVTWSTCAVDLEILRKGAFCVRPRAPIALGSSAMSSCDNSVPAAG